MAIEIYSNSDMPQCLNTEAKQFKEAKELAQLHRGSLAKAYVVPGPKDSSAEQLWSP